MPQSLEELRLAITESMARPVHTIIPLDGIHRQLRRWRVVVRMGKRREKRIVAVRPDGSSQSINKPSELQAFLKDHAGSPPTDSEVVVRTFRSVFPKFDPAL